MSGTVVNTPGYYYAISYWLSASVMIFVQGCGKIDLWKYLYSVLSFISIFTVMFFTDGIKQIFFMPLMICVFGLMLLYMKMAGELPWRETGFYCAKAFINAEFAASLCWQIHYFYTGDFSGLMKGTSEQTAWRLLHMVVIYAVMYILVYLIERYLKKDIEELQITRRELLVVYFVVIVVYCISNVSYVDVKSIFSGGTAMDVFIIRTLADLSGMAVLYAYHIQVKEIQMRFEKDTLQNITNMQYQNYKLSKESIDIVNQKYHDLKHQINLLKTGADTEKAGEYLEQMEREIKIYETQNKTGNKVLDTILTSKSMHCQRHGIELKFMGEGQLLNFMEDMDISALFGNMLDNAIESVVKIKDRQKRLISIHVIQERQFIRIRTENYCEEDVQFQDGLPVTTKKDKRFHGYGTKSIKKIVEKYGGSVMAGKTDNWFELKILIPMKG
ncbi:ATP-binding protein [Blautia glucerasea]|uniref:ATP-binding protein n=1 Tax=Blautia glucerasea TaxID=536633 RepID=UPI001D02844A|nr:ATP-binding protein [Blautia glucerasea]MCB5387284.1 ATP-binding protein [Blautia glucerasea]MCB5421462.1 ATP-binding protein [Blautia luti]